MPRKTFRKVTTSEELLQQVNKDNVFLMKSFLKEKSIRSSATTLVVYESSLNMFFIWNLTNNNNKKFTDIKKIEFSNFFNYMVDELKAGSARVNNMRSTLSSLSTFIEKFYDEEYPTFRNVILKVIESSPKEFRREKTVLTDEQIEGLLQQLLKDREKQKACWLALAITSGARFSELLRFQTTLIDEKRTAFGDMFLETTQQIKTKGRGKAGKLLYKYILKDKFFPYYKEWLEEREVILKRNNESHNMIFVKRDGSPADAATVRRWIADFEDYLKVPFYAHSLRHYLVTLMAKKNIPTNLIQALMGWSSIEMVSVYNDETLADRSFPELQNLIG